MRMLYYQRTQMTPEEERYYGVEYASLASLLAESDHVSIQLPDEERAVAFEHYLKSGSGRAFAKRHFGCP